MVSFQIEPLEKLLKSTIKEIQYMKATTIFQSSDKLKDFGIIAARLGIAFAFIWPGIGKVTNPGGIGQMLQSMGMESAMATQLAFSIGSFEILSGILIALGLVTRPAVIFQIVILVGAQVMFGSDYAQGPAIWKDPALLGIAILLLLYGAGRFSIDHLISKKK